jgi:hypothetical protein
MSAATGTKERSLGQPPELRLAFGISIVSISTLLLLSAHGKPTGPPNGRARICKTARFQKTHRASNGEQIVNAAVTIVSDDIGNSKCDGGADVSC